LTGFLIAGRGVRFDGRFVGVGMAGRWDDGCGAIAGATAVAPWVRPRSSIHRSHQCKAPRSDAGLRGIATLPWLHFVASPQRVPGFGYRLRSRPVVNFIYRVSPHRGHRNTGELSHPRNARDTGRPRLQPRNRKPAKRLRAPTHQIASPTRSDYAEPQRVSTIPRNTHRVNRPYRLQNVNANSTS
jgi:hypothetical protein